MSDPLKNEDVEVIETPETQVKESRGPVKSPPVEKKVAQVPNNWNRKLKPKAKQSHITLQPEGAQFVRVQYMLPPEHKIEDALASEYWAHVTGMFMRPIAREGDYSGSIIEVRNEALTIYAELFIRAVSKEGMKVAMIRCEPVGVTDDFISKTHEFRWNVGAQQFEVLRKSDRKVVFSAKLKEDVLEWMRDRG